LVNFDARDKVVWGAKVNVLKGHNSVHTREHKTHAI